jgi:hypothetical protein
VTQLWRRSCGRSRACPNLIMSDFAADEGRGGKEGRADHEPTHDGAREKDPKGLPLSASPKGKHRARSGDEHGHKAAFGTFFVRLAQRLVEPGLFFELLLCRLSPFCRASFDSSAMHPGPLAERPLASACSPTGVTGASLRPRSPGCSALIPTRSVAANATSGFQRAGMRRWSSPSWNGSPAAVRPNRPLTFNCPYPANMRSTQD